METFQSALADVTVTLLRHAQPTRLVPYKHRNPSHIALSTQSNNNNTVSQPTHSAVNYTAYSSNSSITMFPSKDTINTFTSHHPLNPKLHQPFPAYSVIEDTKSKTDAMTKEASREFNTASQKAQSATGKIEPWSGKYYAACTVGGLLACVRPLTEWIE